MSEPNKADAAKSTGRSNSADKRRDGNVAASTTTPPSYEGNSDNDTKDNGNRDGNDNNMRANDNGNGRPPLSPMIHPNGNHTHDNDNNNTENTNYHRRNISWGMNEILNLGPPASIQRQTSNASSTLSHSMANNTTHTAENGRSSSGGGATHLRVVNMPYQGESASRHTVIELPNNVGVVNPLETEAESYLLRAIENSPSDVDAEANVLGNVSDKALKTMERRLSEDLSAGSRPFSPSTGGSTASSRNLRKAASARLFASPKPHHRRKMTLDEQLFGLTHAMDAMHAVSATPFAGDPTESQMGRLRANTMESYGGVSINVVPEENQEEEEEAENETGAPSTSYETFAQNADAYYEQAMPETSTFNGLTRRQSVKKIFTADDIESGTPTTEDGNKNQSNEKPDPEGKNAASKLRLSKWARLLFEEWRITGEMKDFIRPKQNIIRLYFQIMVLVVAIPSLATAAVLFYFFDNPPTGILKNYGNAINGTLFNTSGEPVDPSSTSVSYFLIFLGIRQTVTLTLALITQFVLIDYLAIDRGYLFALGSRIPLFIMQARGWPFVAFFWSTFDWALVAGSHPFFRHWLYFQKTISIFNGSNPDGNLVSTEWYRRILALMTSISLIVATKRFWMAIFLGRQTYNRFSDKVARLMAKMLLISQVAGLSRQAVNPQSRDLLRKREKTVSTVLTLDDMGGLIDNAGDDASEMGSKGHDDSVGLATTATGLDSAKNTAVIDPDDCNVYTGKLSNVQKNRITQLLGAWEEPTEEAHTIGEISIASLMHFRRAVNHLRTDLPFSASFGPARSREDCVASSQEVFQRLTTLSNNEDVLNFEVLAILGAKSDDSLDQNKLIDLIKLFRPDRDGSLSMVHFVRSVDKVYKDIRMLRASVHNSSKVDGQLETIFNFVFYAIILVIVLATFGLDPLALFVSVSGLILGFAFMIGTASSKYFEGLLFILVRRPYGIGDCIHISDPNTDTSYTGSAFWYVEDITLFSTHVRFYFTNERASLSNGSLANSRIINSSKSFNAGVYHFLKFPLDVTFEKVQIFHEALQTFVRNRPREWIGLSSFRAVSVNAQLGYIEYIVCIDHRESWAYWSQVRTSQSDIIGFGVELAKQLDIVYKQPTLPIDLSLKRELANDIASEMTHSEAPAIPHPSTFQGPSLPNDFQSLGEKFPHRAPVNRRHQ